MSKNKKNLYYFNKEICRFRIINDNVVEHNDFRRNDVCERFFVIDVIDFVCEKFFDIRHDEKQIHIRCYEERDNDERYCQIDF